jgi:hypothetical protein
LRRETRERVGKALAVEQVLSKKVSANPIRDNERPSAISKRLKALRGAIAIRRRPAATADVSWRTRQTAFPGRSGWDFAFDSVEEADELLMAMVLQVATQHGSVEQMPQPSANAPRGIPSPEVSM